MPYESLKMIAESLYDIGETLVKFPAGVLVGAVGSFALPSYWSRAGYFGRNSFTMGQGVGSMLTPSLIVLGTIAEEALRMDQGDVTHPERLLPLALFVATNVASYFIERHIPNSYFSRHRM